MNDNTLFTILNDWTTELNASLLKSKALYIALFSSEKKLLFSTQAMSLLFKDEPYQNLINPTFEKLLLLDKSELMIFEGYVTLGDYNSVNISIFAQTIF